MGSQTYPSATVACGAWATSSTWWSSSRCPTASPARRWGSEAMGTLSAEWDWWAIINGVPAFIGGVLFISAPWLRRAATGVGIRLPDGVGFFDQRFAWDIAA